MFQVPVRFSSLQRRIVSALLKKMSRTGIHENKGLTSAILREKKGSPQKKINNVTAAKVAKNKYAIGEAKNKVISFARNTPNQKKVRKLLRLHALRSPVHLMLKMFAASLGRDLRDCEIRVVTDRDRAMCEQNTCYISTGCL